MSKVIRNLHLIPGVSGCGKTTVAKYMARKLEYADMVVGYTTRPARANEEDGVDYHFRNITHLHSKLGELGWRYRQIGEHYYYANDTGTLPNDTITTKVLPVSFSVLDEVIEDYSYAMTNDCKISVAPIIIGDELRGSWLSITQPLRPSRDLRAELTLQDEILSSRKFDGLFYPTWSSRNDAENYLRMYNIIRRQF